MTGKSWQVGVPSFVVIAMGIACVIPSSPAAAPRTAAADAAAAMTPGTGRDAAAALEGRLNLRRTPGGAIESPQHANRSVKLTIEHDEEGGNVFRRSRVLTLEFDARGYLVRQLVEWFDPADAPLPGITELWWSRVNSHGQVVESANEYSCCGGTGGYRNHMRTVESDARGNPTRQVTEEDWLGNVTIDNRLVTTIAYDARGNPVRRVIETDYGPNGVPEFRTFFHAEYDARGNVVHIVSESDNGADGSIDWSDRAEHERDPLGWIVRSVFTNDDDDDGTIDLRRTVAQSHTVRGSLLEESFAYDEHDDGIIDIESRISTLEADSRGEPLHQLEEIVGHRRPEEVRTTIHRSMERDERGDLTLVLEEVDAEADGAIDSRRRILYEYPGAARPRPDGLLLLGGPALASELRVSPNPSTGSTTLRFALPEPAPVSLRIHDVRGRLVCVLVEDAPGSAEAQGTQGTGTVETTWDGRDRTGAVVAPGVYFARLRVGDQEQSRTILRVR